MPTDDPKTPETFAGLPDITTLLQRIADLEAKFVAFEDMMKTLWARIHG